MCPQSKLRHAFESAVSAPDDETDFAIEDLLNLVQQMVLLVGKTSNSISYHRRLISFAGA